jgi:DNA-binding LacI/PurR family transcriptional regulator
MRELLGRDVAFDAVLAFNDSLAFGAMRALGDAGRLVPGDVAVIGIDNVAEAAYSMPSLTTVDLGIRRTAETAVQLLAAQFAESSPPPQQRLLVEFGLVERESTAR